MSIEYRAKIQTLHLPDPISAEDYLEQLSHLKDEGYEIKEMFFSPEKRIELINQEKIFFNIDQQEEKEKLYLLTKDRKGFILLINNPSSEKQIADTSQLSVRVVQGDRDQFLGWFKALNGYNNMKHWFFTDFYLYPSFSYTNASLEFQDVEPNEVADFLPNL